VGKSGSLALGEVHQGVRGEVIQAAAEFIETIINHQLIPSILALNYGDTEEPPEVCLEPEKLEDQKANAERDQILLNAGVELPKDWFYKRHNIPMPQAGEETIAGKPAPASPSLPLPVPAAGKPLDPPMAARAARDSGLRARLATELGVPDSWLAPVNAWISDLESAASDERLTARQVLDFADAAHRRLPELFGKMDHAALARLLEGSMGAATLQGVREALAARSPATPT
jgi:phage gp29-like protein